MGKRNGKENLKVWVFLLLMAFVVTSGGCGGSSDDSVFAGGGGTSADPWRIATVGQLEQVRNHLDGYFVLTDDIDLSSYSNWTPIGEFVPAPDGDGETPVMDLTFTGVFDGGGHKISNVTAVHPESSGVGLFGCIAGDSVSIKNLTVENVKVEGTMLVGGVVGYGSEGVVRDVRLTGDNTIKGGNMAGGMGGMVGGIVGGSFCDIVGCEAQADVVLSGNNSQVVGVLAGGMEDCAIADCSAKGSVTVTGTGSIGIGGLAGCSFSQKVENCTSDVVMTVGDGNRLIGGLLGYAGAGSGEPTVISNCSAAAVITAPNTAERIGGIVGGGFFVQEYREYRPEPGAIRVTNCQTSGEINGGSIVGSILGYAYNNSSAEGCTSDMKVNGAAAEQVGATLDDVTLDDLR
ncbi:MAG: hypothetical protein LBS53_02990 [Synergistaceae bacterium]|nr:hypothetical protein [Synergistaceae bacterium]